MNIPDPPATEERQLRLITIRLPAGDVAPFDVMSTWNNGANRQHYQIEGYDGIRFVGRGMALTHIRPTVGNVTSSHATVVIGRLAKHVEFEGVSVHCAPNANGIKGKAIHCGEAQGSGPLVPLTLKMRDVAIVADEPATWGAFTYGTFEDYERVLFDCELLYEHADYAHGFNIPGRSWVDVEVEGAGAECSKGVCRPGESLWTPGAWLKYKRCRFTNWYQEHSWRGGAGIVLQGPGANVLIEECEFRAPKEGHANAPVYQRGKCLMLSDTGSTQYSAITGVAATGPGLGWVIIRRNLFEAGPGGDNMSVMLRIGSESDYRNDPYVARGFLIEENGIYGERMLAQLGATRGHAVIRRNNTPTIRAYAEGRGFDTRHECQYAVSGYGLANFSTNWSKPE